MNGKVYMDFDSDLDGVEEIVDQHVEQKVASAPEKIGGEAEKSVIDVNLKGDDEQPNDGDEKAMARKKKMKKVMIASALAASLAGVGAIGFMVSNSGSQESIESLVSKAPEPQNISKPISSADNNAQPSPAVATVTVVEAGHDQDKQTTVSVDQAGNVSIHGGDQKHAIENVSVSLSATNVAQTQTADGGADQAKAQAVPQDQKDAGQAQNKPQTGEKQTVPVVAQSPAVAGGADAKELAEQLKKERELNEKLRAEVAEIKAKIEKMAAAKEEKPQATQQKKPVTQPAVKVANGVTVLKDGIVVKKNDGEQIFAVGDSTPFGNLKVVNIDNGSFETDKGKWKIQSN